MDDNELIEKLMKMFMLIKSTHFHNIIQMDELTHNEKLVLFLLHEISIENEISLSVLREKIKLAPSTITPIITSLEAKGLITRKIDKIDRRNIHLKLSLKGIKYTTLAHTQLVYNIKEYINYMGKDDTKELIKLLSKTAEYIKERKKKE
ncbi:MAG: MarR family transcriptional regulator [Clostridia bacterium]